MSTMPIRKQYVLSQEATDKLLSALGLDKSKVTFLSLGPAAYGNILTVEAIEDSPRELSTELPDLSKGIKAIN